MLGGPSQGVTVLHSWAHTLLSHCLTLPSSINEYRHEVKNFDVRGNPVMD